MLISIITPLYNAEKFIASTIESVLAQSYQKWEMIIVDDNSSDTSVDIVDKYIKNDDRIKYIKLNKQHGPGGARNIAIEKAKGQYIAFLDADDLWMPHKLETQLDFMQINNLAFTYSSYGLIDEYGNDIGTFHTKETISYDSMLKTCSVGCLTAIYDVNKLGKIYMPEMFKGEDYAAWLGIIKTIKTTQGILEPLAYYRILGTSASSNKVKALKAQWYIYRKIEKLNIFKSIYYVVHYAYNGFFKYR